MIEQLFRELIKSEKFSEALKEAIAATPRFSLSHAFDILDKDENGFITIDELRDVLLENGYYASTGDLMGLMKKYDRNSDGRITKGEFLREMTPKKI